jgi:hypothetical protein
MKYEMEWWFKNNEFKSVCKAEVMTFLQAVTNRLSGEPEENHEKPTLRRRISGPKF